MLPNWLYGKSKSKLAELLGGGGTPSDYAEVKAKVTQNAGDIALLNSTVESIETEMVRGGGYVYKITSYFRHITITAPRGIYGLVKLFTQHGEIMFSTDGAGIVNNTLSTQKVLLNRTDSSALWTYRIDGLSVAFDLGIGATAMIFSTVPLEITPSNTSTPETNTMSILNLALLSNS